MHDLRSSFVVLSLLCLVGAACGCGASGASPSTSSVSSPSPGPSPSPSPSPSPAPSPTPTPSPVSTGVTGSGLTIAEPSPDALVSSPFSLSADAAVCSSQTVTQIGFALDSSATETIISGSSLHTAITTSAGKHTVSVKVWGNAGAVCSSDVTVTVATPPAPAGPAIPSNAVGGAELQALSSWNARHDPAAGSSSSGSTSTISSPSLSGKARRFDTSFSGSGGELYYLSYGSDANATNFVYDAWVYLTSSASSIANLEMDMNQVLGNGETIIYGFQCDGYSGTWDYTENAGSPSSPSDRWVHSHAACNVRTWTQNTWHHVQIAYSRDNSGKVTYHSVWLDGAESAIEATVPSAFALGWGKVLLTNFQIDGLGNGANTVYLDHLTILRW